MKRFLRSSALATFLAIGLAGAATAASGSEIAYVPLGSDNKLVLVDISTDKVIGDLKGLSAVHGLAGTPDGKYLIAGSYEGRDRGEAAPAKPSGMSDSDHAAHHKPSASSPGSKSTEISTLTIISTSDRSIVRQVEVPGEQRHQCPNEAVAQAKLFRRESVRRRRYGTSSRPDRRR